MWIEDASSFRFHPVSCRVLSFHCYAGSYLIRFYQFLSGFIFSCESILIDKLDQIMTNKGNGSSIVSCQSHEFLYFLEPRDEQMSLQTDGWTEEPALL